jgi:hypothetical protein
MHVGGVFCNLAQDFDCVNHEILLAKFNDFQGTDKNWFRSYLIDRKQTTTKIISFNESQNFSQTGKQQNMEFPMGWF